MPGSLIAPIIVGAVLFFLGIVFIIWGKREESRYYDSLATRGDLREFFSRWPPRAEPGALKAGGWISMVVGIITVGVGFLIWWLGQS